MSLPPLSRLYPPPARLCSCLSLPPARWVQAFRVRSEDGIAELHVGCQAPSALALALLVVLEGEIYEMGSIE